MISRNTSQNLLAPEGRICHDENCLVHALLPFETDVDIRSFMSDFQSRPASQNWEQVPLAWIPGGFVWAWFKPPQAPGAIVVRLPDEQGDALRPQLTMRNLIAALGADLREIPFWSIQGMMLDSQGGQNPLLDQPVPPPVPWADPTITIHFAGVPQPGFAAGVSVQPVAASSAMKTAPMTPAAESALAAMDADWNAILLMETQLAQLRKQLSAIQAKLQSLNRDFTPEERQAADSNDVKAWQDARRFLRDAAGQTSRYIREHDVGMTSAAGQRHRFEEIYKTHVTARNAFEGISSVQHEMEVYRKQVQALLSKMQTALSNAGSNGEQRAQQVLSRIGAKMRRSRNRD